MTRTVILLVLTMGLLSSGDRTPRETPPAASRAETVIEVHEGFASYYPNLLNGRRTASGEVLDNRAMVAAHPTYPFGTIVRVTNLANGKTVTVRVIDRGPAPRVRRRGVIIDLSRAAAEKLDFMDEGRARVRIERRPALRAG